MLDLEVVIVNFGSTHLVLDQVARLAGIASVTVVDNSRDPLLRDACARASFVGYISPETNIGFGAACDMAAGRVDKGRLLFLNPDCVVDPDTVSRIMTLMDARPTIAACSPSLLDEAGNPLPCGGAEPTFTKVARFALRSDTALGGAALWYRPSPLNRRSAEFQSLDWAAGTCLVVDRAAFLAVGGFGKEFFLYSEDVLLGRKLRFTGWEVGVHTGAVAVHSGRGSTPASPEDLMGHWAESTLRYQEMHSPGVTRHLTIGLMIAGLIRRAATQPGDALDYPLLARSLACAARPLALDPLCRRARVTADERRP